MLENSHTLKSFIALIIGILFAIVISEIILQILDVPLRPISGWLSCKTECNSMGFRGHEITYSDDDFVVILLGDSEACSPASPFEQMPERRLENFLRRYRKNVKVFTIADMGYGQDQQYLALKKYFEKYRADLVLLMSTIRNDIDNNMFPTSGGNNTIKPTFWLKNGELRGPTEEWLALVGPRMKLALLWKSYLQKTLGESRLQKWKMEILPTPYQSLKRYKGAFDTTWDEMWKQNPKEVYAGIDYERESVANQLTPRSEMRKYGIDLSRKLFTKIKELAEANNGHFIIFKEERPWEIQYTEKVNVHYMNGKYYMLSMRQYHDNLKELYDGFESYRIPLELDNYTASSDSEHLNQQAIDKLFKEIAQIISRKEYFKE